MENENKNIPEETISSSNEHEIRVEKVKKMRSEGIEPWPYREPVTETCQQVKDKFVDEGDEKSYDVAGRVITVRLHGKTGFCTIQDRTGRLQVYIKKDLVGDEPFEFFKNYVDMGDIVWFSGTSFKTKTGEITIRVEKFKAILETTNGQFFGIGIVIGNTRSQKDKFLGVINTIPGGPADKAGVKAEDNIIEIDGKKLEGMTTEEATAKLRGERNTKVTVKVIREKVKAPLSFEIVRDVIKEQSSLAFYIKNHNIFYVSLTTFSKNSAKQIRKILKRSTKQSYKGIILDLRNNSGGLLRSVINIAGLFLNKGSLVAVTKDKHDKKIAQYKTTQKPVANVKIPIFILVNNYTASAAEILAGCLKIQSQKLSEKSKKKPQKRLMVFIVGTSTFGKGSVQEVIPISNNCAIKLTTSLYFLPDDKTIQGTGIKPDFIIPKLFPPPQKVVWFMENYGREKSLKHSIKPNDANKKETDKKDKKSDKKAKTWAERIKAALSMDNQFSETIQLINALYVAKKKCHKKINNRQKAIEYLQSIFALNGKIELEQVKI